MPTNKNMNNVTPPVTKKGLGTIAYAIIALLVIAIILLATGVVKMSPFD